MAFGLGKLAVLESKLDIYEDLSKEMLDKLEPVSYTHLTLPTNREV